MGFPVKILGRNTRTFSGASLTTSYQSMGAVTTIAAYRATILNASTTDVQVTDNTSQDAFYVPAGATVSVGDSEISNADGSAVFAKGQQLQIKLPSGVAGTGTVIVTILGN